MKPLRRWIAGTCNMCGVDFYSDEDHRCEIGRHRAEMLRLRAEVRRLSVIVERYEPAALSRREEGGP